MRLATGLKPIVQAPIDSPVMRTPSVAAFATDTGPSAVPLAGVDSLRTWSVLLTEPESGRVVGVALYGKPGTALPGFTPPRTRRRTRRPAASAQLDLFADLR